MVATVVLLGLVLTAVSTSHDFVFLENMWEEEHAEVARGCLVWVTSADVENDACANTTKHHPLYIPCLWALERDLAVFHAQSGADAPSLHAGLRSLIDSFCNGGRVFVAGDCMQHRALPVSLAMLPAGDLGGVLLFHSPLTPTGLYVVKNSLETGNGETAYKLYLAQKTVYCTGYYSSLHLHLADMVLSYVPESLEHAGSAGYHDYKLSMVSTFHRCWNPLQLEETLESPSYSPPHPSGGRPSLGSSATTPMFATCTENLPSSHSTVLATASLVNRTRTVLVGGATGVTANFYISMVTSDATRWPWPAAGDADVRFNAASLEELDDDGEVWGRLQTSDIMFDAEGLFEFEAQEREEGGQLAWLQLDDDFLHFEQRAASTLLSILVGSYANT